jgi:hypothetical protein
MSGGRRVGSILVVDSQFLGRPEARLPRVLASLKSYRERAHAYGSTRPGAGADYHDVDAFDLALVHLGDADDEDQVFHRRCWRANVPCVVYSGNPDRIKAESPRLLYLSDTNVFEHAEEGIRFLEATGLLSLHAWTRGRQAACEAEVASLCHRIRQPFLPGSPPAPLPQVWPELVRQLRDWSDDQRYLTRVNSLEQIGAPGASAIPGGVSRLFDLLDELPRYVRPRPTFLADVGDRLRYDA